MIMKIAITGGTGFVGNVLSEELIKHGHELFILTRNPDKQSAHENITFIGWMTEGATPETHLDGIDAFINLAGESINSGRWTEERKRRILASRIEATQEALRIIRNLENKPASFINASAIGIYPSSVSRTYTEASTEQSEDFLGQTVQIWEREAGRAREMGLRVAFMRFGIVLGKGGGALPKMAIPYKLFAGGPVGSGEQWMSWIHIQDIAKGISYTLQHEDIEGPVNLTAPHPLQMNEFGKVLGEVLGRPHWLPVPSLALKAAMGDMSTLVLDGQKVIPEVLLNHGFEFEYPDLKEALQAIYK